MAMPENLAMDASHKVRLTGARRIEGCVEIYSGEQTRLPNRRTRWTSPRSADCHPPSGRVQLDG